MATNTLAASSSIVFLKQFFFSFFYYLSQLVFFFLLLLSFSTSCFFFQVFLFILLLYASLFKASFGCCSLWQLRKTLTHSFTVCSNSHAISSSVSWLYFVHFHWLVRPILQNPWPWQFIWWFSFLFFFQSHFLCVSVWHNFHYNYKSSQVSSSNILHLLLFKTLVI